MKKLHHPILTVTLLLMAPLARADHHEGAWLHLPAKEGTANGKKIVLISGDEEYRSEESCPMLGKILSQHHGFDCTVLFAINPDGGFVDSNYQKNIPGMEAVREADLVIIGTRFRNLPDEQFQPLADHLNAGKPVFGFRTATHAFQTPSKVGGIPWGQFGPAILGEGWAGHYGGHKKQGARGVAAGGAEKHPLLHGVGEIFAESDVYGVRRVDASNAEILIHGVVTDTLYQDSKDTPGKEPQPAVWLRDYTTPAGGKGVALCTTFGASSDLDDENLRRLFVNAAFFLTGLEVPAQADVTYVDPFQPSIYGFNKGGDYYKMLNLRPADYGLGKSPQTGPPLESLVPPRPKPEPPAPASGKKEQAAVEAVPTPIEVQRGGQRPTYQQPKAAGDRKAAPVALPYQPAKGENLVFIGNCLPERMQHFGHFEALLHRSFPGSEITFRNMGFPGHTPAFRPESGQPDPWAFPGAEKFRPEIDDHYGKGHYPKPDEWLTLLQADTIVAFFGFNESYDGPEGAANFKDELTAFTDHTLSRMYNDKHPPRLVLVTPVAMEQHRDYFLPDAAERNRVLAAYAAAIREVAEEKQVGFVDLFTVTSHRFAETGAAQPLTINGIHLGDEGYAELAPVLFEQLYGKPPASTPVDEKLLRAAVTDKSWVWRNDYRMLNGVHAYGQRWAPYGNFNYPEEIDKIRQMTVLRDRNIWAIARGASTSLQVDDARTRPLTPVVTNYKPGAKTGNPEYLLEAEALQKFTLAEGYEVSVFATEQEFPNLQNPAQMTFDNAGRLWVSVVPSYPHYQPGDPRPNDKLLVYEDTDGDGRADKETVFADRLHLPIGFELAPEGVYISEEPFLTLHKDTDGDGKADTKEYVLGGFDPHDTHHAISAFTTDYGGGLFMCEGRFLHSQVETPYGPQRMTDGGAWRFDPRSWKVERAFQSDVSNPWGVAHDEYGQNFLNDASGGSQWWMLPLSMKVPHGHEITKVEKFNYEHHIRPTSGNEFIYSSHFPDEVQGDYIYCNTIGFLGIKQYRVVEDGTAIRGQHRQDLIVSSDGNFRPADLEMAPDGSLYFIDWHNALIGHMQHSARDPMRNSEYGRIYRITYPSRPLVTPPEIAGASLETLFENLKLPELQARRRSHRELRGRDAAEVVRHAHEFAARNSGDERLVLEALWATWGQQRPSAELIETLLKAQDHRVRSGTVRVVRHCLHLLEDPARYLQAAAVDAHFRVRLEALSAATWLGGREGARILLTVASQPTDRWIRNALNSGILLLRGEADALLSSAEIDPATIPDLDLLLASNLPAPENSISVLTKGVKLNGKENKALRAAYKQGETVFHREGSCVTCHLATGEGMPGIWPPIALSEWANGNKERLIKLTLHGIWGKITVKGKEYDPAKGVPPMTALGAMYSDEEIAAVLTYVRHSWGNHSGPVTREEVAAVRNATSGRTGFYSPEELLVEHPMEVAEAAGR